ncbi:MAG: VTT domain-containing protein [Candidatus Methanoperedens sp.]|nr:VTT domain-containing protein [Candidatus Methanoperedens sp.]MCZ7370048.1 VTT domain-containing protein [Candidatus Methanoperedens sp.]
MTLFDLFISYGMIGLFIISIISSIIPIPTEPVVFGLLGIGGNPDLIFIILTSGSILGASAGYFMGKHGLTKIIQFRNKENDRKIQMYFHRHGALLLLISPWIPLVVDLAPIAAGIENYDSKRFLIVISIANIIKSIGIVFLSISIINWWTLFMK